MEALGSIRKMRDENVSKIYHTTHQVQVQLRACVLSHNAGVEYA